LLDADPRILGRTVIILIDLYFEGKIEALFARNLLKEIISRADDEEAKNMRNYVGQSAKRKMFKAETDKDVLHVFETFCSLGLKLEKIRAWDVMMKKLIPNVPENGSWTQAALMKRVHDVKDTLSSQSIRNESVYSHSVIWGTIIQHLLNRENELFFATAASLCVSIKVAFAPKRWHLSLANCLLKLKDTKSFVDILEVSYKNSLNKGDTSDYYLVASSLSTCASRGIKWKVDTEQLLCEVLDEIWKRGIKIPPGVRDEMIDRLDNSNLSNALENIPVLGKDTFKKTAQLNRIGGRVIR